MAPGNVEKLSAPARKIFVDQLKHCSMQKSSDQDGTKADSGGDAKYHWMWQINPGKEDLRVQLDMVWIQGTVLECFPDAVVVHDGTGKVRGELYDVKKSKKCSPDETLVTKGSYVLLVGTILSVGEIPAIRALKCSELKDPDVHKELWQSEVLHQQRFVSR
ncbi:RecQ-mediated genome instability protein 2 [Holothuria leucospilota]|uniref:RecQ-mediated genome instability protein 2 n=1 Tax=Holothuria leucospilota TaxID=206669 RepID=A0A9Q1C973_HOLLE|nr:RecQ-mediated genome instability protein 2 [Holothuria leucospilota]